MKGIIKFRYRGRRVKGEVLSSDNKGILLLLYTDYIGKNEDWFIGETKYFHKGVMKQIKKIQ